MLKWFISEEQEKEWKGGEYFMTLKEGDKVKISLTEGDYRVRWIGDRMVVLETEDKSSQFLTSLDNLKPYDSPRAPKK